MSPNAPVDLSKEINYNSLKDRNVLITGGASGFGKEFVRLFAKHGANIVFGDLSDGPAKDLETELSNKGVKIKFTHVDVTSFESQAVFLREALDFFPRNEVDIFIPNAGIISLPTKISPADPAELVGMKAAPADFSTRVLEVNLLGVWTGVMLVSRYGMGLHKSTESSPSPPKSIVLIASLAGYCGAEGAVEYTASKFGVRGLLRGFRKQLAGLGVRINAVSPFYVDTPLISFATPALKAAGIPLAPIDLVIEAVARLATDDEAYGRSIFVMPEGLSDGGDDSKGGQGGKSFSIENFGEHWSILINGPLSDDIPE